MIRKWYRLDGSLHNTLILRWPLLELKLVFLHPTLGFSTQVKRVGEAPFLLSLI